MNALSILVVTGQSGSGKSTALRALEDVGYFCVDNVPVSLVGALLDTLRRAAGIERVALGIDARERTFLEAAPAQIEELRRGSDKVRLLFLESREEVLLRRFSETRRRHPLDTGAGLRAAIGEERRLLAPLREIADDTIDSTALSPHALRDLVVRQAETPEGHDRLAVALVSFGFKRGLPLDADVVLDVRFLRNPYFDAALRSRTGEDAEVRQYVLDNDEGRELLDRFTDLLTYLVPRFQKEGKRYLTVAIGCTGGQHRSVSVVHALGARLGAAGLAVDLRHRDLVGRASETGPAPIEPAAPGRTP